MKNRITALITSICLLIAACLAIIGRADSKAKISTDLSYYQVVSVTDGDTITLKDSNAETFRVRIIGIDCPEMHSNEKALRDSKRSNVDIKTILYLGRQSYQHLKKILQPGSRVKIDYDKEKKDQYGRTLAYVYLPDGTFINQKMLEDGYAYPLSISPNLRFEKQFREAAQRARKNKVGLWRESDILAPPQFP